MISLLKYIDSRKLIGQDDRAYKNGVVVQVINVRIGHKRVVHRETDDGDDGEVRERLHECAVHIFKNIITISYKCFHRHNRMIRQVSRLQFHCIECVCNRVQ